jgi:uncharacterized RDD family membrane protein YckC
MKCQSCGHDYPGTLTRCTVCGHLTTRRNRSFSESRLIEFPRQARLSANSNTAASNVPAWRLEVTERVRQIKAKRTTTTVDPEEGPVNVQVRPDSAEPTPSSAPPRSSRDNNPIVEAALTRVRRAKQEGTGLPVPAVSGSMVTRSGGKNSMVVDREATARALDPSEDPRTLELNQLAPETARSFNPSNAATGTAKAPIRSSGSALPHTDKALRPETNMGGKAQTDLTRRDIPEESGTVDEMIGSIDPLDAGPIEEIEPVDYLEAEVRKVDKHLARELMSDDSAPLFSHVVAGLTDLLAIAVSSAPFLALIVMIHGSFSDTSTLMWAGILIILLAFFYFSLTQSLSGRTFGMMLTNTRIIEAATGKRPSVQRALLRCLCYPIAVAPVGIGILWAAFDRRHRGWQDLISGTVVIRDF